MRPAASPDIMRLDETSWNGLTSIGSGALRRSSARPGDVVAILGVGGLGHLGVQFAAKLGFEVRDFEIANPST